ncbi:restriction endonuclease subunit S [Mycobacterium sp. E1747]|uniref:restriction endonuclease subunit S n=1 Tax=Mycobacterium sp. E1747 TaxID=1834128 RepID=UPI0009ED492A|nr:restriction endonuclease subunit S [Mycobacterium sp. E1747]
MTDWFDNLPAGWDVSRLRNIIESTQTGVWGDDPRGDDDDIRCVRVADFDRPRSAVGSVDTLRSVSQKDREGRLLEPGDILLEKSGGTDNNPVGFSVMFNGAYPAVSSNFITRLRVKRSQMPRFWLYALDASYATKRTERSVRRTTGIQNLDQKAFFNEEFPVPPLTEQRAIADFLDRETARIDTLICEQNQLVELLHERRQAVLERCVTRGLDEHAPLRPSTLGWTPYVPEHWTVANIRRFAAMKTGHTPSRSVAEYWVDCDIPWFTLADVWQLRDSTRTYLGESSSMISKLGLENSAAELLPAGTVVLSRTASVGFTGIMPTAMATSQDYWNWVCGPRLLPEYLVYVFRAMRNEFQALMIGSTHKTIYQPVAAAIRIPVPPLDEQRRIAAHLDEQTSKIDTLIAETRKFIELARERRSALINAAVTGQIDVRNEVA